MSEITKAAWKRGVYANVNFGGGHHNHSFTHEEQSKGAMNRKVKAEHRNSELISQGKYELLSKKALRAILLEEAHYACEICHNSEWLEKPIWLEVHHKDGNNKNDKRKNLLVVCINCHSVVDKRYRRNTLSTTYRPRKNILLEEVNYTCEICHNSEWLGESIWLEVHHKDDDNKNSKRDNLLVVCLNCHSVIDEKYRFRGRSSKNRE